MCVHLPVSHFSFLSHFILHDRMAFQLPQPVIPGRRVSIILQGPSPDNPPPTLSIPPLTIDRRHHPALYIIPKTPSSSGVALGSRNPFLKPANNPSTKKKEDDHPRHALGVNALALDTTTILKGESNPGGILYTAGRDGMVASWDLDIPHTRRTSRRYGSIDGRNKLRKVRWEFIGDGADFFRADEEDREGNSDVEDEGDGEEGWVDMKETMEEIPFEDRYEVDKAELSRRSPKTTFRQSSQTHTDWVNSLLLCNYNRTVITASSDRTIRSWTPHSSLSASSPSGAADPSRPSPALVGTHTDFVKSLAFAEGPGYLWSGSLDQKICLWDIQQGSGDCQPILDVDLQAQGVHGGGVYTLAIGMFILSFKSC